MNLDHFLIATERENSDAATVDSVLMDPSGWALQAMRNLSLDSEVIL